jgi:oligopeptide/dipeptide ABC transporter ATP-binding protein
MKQTTLSVNGLYKHFPVARTIIERLTFHPQKVVHAVDGVSFELNKGEIMALVGESGSGKTTVGMNVLGLQSPTKGQVLFQDRDVAVWSRGELKTADASAEEKVQDMPTHKQVLLLRRKAQMVFQDPYESLDPRQTIFQIVAEPLEIHGLAQTEDEKRARVKDALELCGLAPAEHFWDRYPERLSGGQRQRVVIAAALVLDPELLVADEPVSMLDVSIRAEILNLLLKLRNEKQLSILYTTHDLATAGYFTDKMAVMYLGRIVEMGPTRDILLNPKHPYTRSLVSVLPTPNQHHKRERVILEGEVPNPIDLPSGCRFHPRCPIATDACKRTDPPMVDVGNAHKAACLFVDVDKE